MLQVHKALAVLLGILSSDSDTSSSVIQILHVQ